MRFDDIRVIFQIRSKIGMIVGLHDNGDKRFGLIAVWKDWRSTMAPIFYYFEFPLLIYDLGDTYP